MIEVYKLAADFNL